MMTLKSWQRTICALLYFALCSVAAPQLSAQDQVTTRPDLAALAPLERARVLRAQGLYKDAIEILRDLVRAQPNNLTFREELGYVLILDRQMSAAQFQFELLLDRTNNPERRRLYSAVLRRIAAERPAGVNLILSFGLSSNLNSGTFNSVLDGGPLGELQIDENSRSTSGWEGAVGLAGFLRTPLGEAGLLRLDGRVQRNVFSEALDNNTEYGLDLTYTRFTRWGELGVTIRGEEQRAGDEKRTEYGVVFRGEYAANERVRYDARFEHVETDFKLRTELSGDAQQLEIGASYTPRPSLLWRFGLRLEQGAPELEHQQYQGAAAVFQVATAFQNGVELSGGLVLGHRDFEGVFPLQTQARADDYADITMTVFSSKLRWRGIVPKLNCRSRFNRSNIALFDYNQHECGIELTRRF